ncbi:putative immune-responsive protein [Mollisia scopiformis]|uniref:Putative immune-responsive protein n=1 Tax=Mollisia scopiformis TaxID=149040 RepID=A0A194WU65_MOLSC|nr:putative immune-responsive protein [Mollisia scopiformis]KUJ11500.1 putative immune-responsive protein [Mollisia scopiformis]
MAQSSQPMDPEGPTGKLCSWIDSVQLSDIPESVQIRAKYLILDGIGCALVGAHLPWSEKAVNVFLDIETPGQCALFGWDKKISPLTAALLNSTFIQGFELDDWHSEAPLHSNSILLPALFASFPVLKSPVSGPQFLLSYLVGLETGPRVGNALHGSYILTQGWHSGAVFGPSASAAAVSKLFDLNAAQVEDALGIACTQACGLMSAQFESEVKRMQHGFPSRNGLMAALLARGGYIGIKKVYEREFGGFLDMFSKGNGNDPQFKIDELTAGLGSVWKTENVKLKPYSAMAATHPTIDCIRNLQEQDKEKMQDLDNIESITLEMGDVSYSHGGFEVQRPLTSVGAQMSCMYVAVTQMVDKEVMPQQFRQDMLDRDVTWGLVEKMKCKLNKEWKGFEQQAELKFKDGTTIQAHVVSTRGVDPELSNGEIVEKYRGLMKGVIDDETRDEIERLCLGLDGCDDMMKLCELLGGVTKNPIA